MPKGVGGATNHPARISKARRNELRLLVCKGCPNDIYNWPLQKEKATTTHAGQELHLEYVEVNLGNGCYTFCQHMTTVDARRTAPCHMRKKLEEEGGE